MKTSNKILLALGFISFAYILGYNIALRKEFDKGDYKRPYYGMKELNLGKFKIVENNAAHLFGIRIQQGAEYKIYLNPYVSDKLSFVNHGGVLQMKYIGSGTATQLDGGVIVVCPAIDSVIAEGPKVADSQRNIDVYNSYINTKVQGFTQPHLGVRANHRTTILLNDNHLGRLNVFLGDNNDGRGLLTVLDNNKIDQADLNVHGRSVLTLYGTSIAKSNNRISDSATVSLNKGALALLMGAKNISQ